MQTIWKYQLNPKPGIQTFSMPAGATILSVRTMNETCEGPCIWAWVDSDRGKEDRQIEIIFTGQQIQEIPKSRKFIGTVVWGRLVLHVFELEHPIASLVPSLMRSMGSAAF